MTRATLAGFFSYLMSGFPMTTPYNTNDEIRQRLQTAGYLFFADENQSGSVDTVEAADNITTSNTWAGALVDEAICEFCQPANARGQANDWLKGRHIDLAAYRVSTLGGGEEIASLKQAFEDAKAALDRVRGGQKVPSLTYNYPANQAARSHRFPVAINPR